MKLKVTLCGGVCVFAMAAPAMAQHADDGKSATGGAVQTTSTAANRSESETLETVVITGSRIIRDGYNSPTPVTAATIEELEDTTPSSIPDALNKLPQFAGSAGGANAGSGAPTVYGGNYLNLRNFGIIRTLILLDGRRVTPTSQTGQVDVNILPQMLVQRVDVVTGGASAVYGSDAITGVVNFVLDKNYTGLKAVAQKGRSEYGDADSYRLGLAGGTSVTDRGHFIWSVERYDNEGIPRHEDRPWSASNPIYIGNGTQGSPFILVQNGRLANATFGGLVTDVKNGTTSVANSPLLNQQFLPNGTLGAFNAGTVVAAPSLSSGGEGGYFSDLTLTAPTTTNQGFGRFQYEFLTNLTAYVQATVAQTRLNGQRSANMNAIALTVPSTNPYLPTSTQTALGPNGSLTVNRLFRDLAYDSRQYQSINAWNYTVGLNGLLGKFNWDASFTDGQDSLHSVLTNNVNLPHLYAAADAVKDSSGNIVCRAGTTLYPGCVPLDALGVGNISPAAKAYIYQNTEWAAVQKLRDYEVNISGPIYNSWAGPISLALNAEYRTQSLDQTSNVDPLVPPSFTGINGAPTVTPSSTVYGYTVQGSNSGRNRVWETAVETVVPLLSDLPFAKSLEASGAIRYTDYSSSGVVHTWKYGATYQPINDVRFRWTESQDIRAPTLNDLYAPSSVSLVVFNDPVCVAKPATPATPTTPATPATVCSRQVKLTNSGNPNLVPEVARTTTIGVVYSPSFLPTFKISVDYYEINIDNAIGTIGGNTTGIAQECAASGGTSPVCAFIQRTSPTAFPVSLTSTGLNASQTSTEGVDVESSYNFQLNDIVRSAPGRISLRALYAYQPHLKQQAYATSTVSDGAGIGGLSSSRVTGNIDYAVGPVKVSWQARYNSSVRKTGNVTVFYADPHLPGIWYHDLGLNYTFKAIQAFLTVSNAFNQPPRISPTTNFSNSPGFGSPTPGGDDLVGRFYTAGVRIRL
jgi:iron complex outermembrane receptor protein